MILLNYSEILNLKHWIDAMIKQHFQNISRIKIIYNRNIIDPNICKELYAGRYEKLPSIGHSTNIVTACVLAEVNNSQEYRLDIDLLAWYVSE